MSTTKYYEFGFKNNLWNKKTSNIGIVPSKGTRYPIRGYYRKTLECCDNNKQKLTLKINKDNYSKCSDKTICDRKGRTSKPIIRSGMQPKKQTRESQAKINALETELATALAANADLDTSDKLREIKAAKTLVFTPYSYSYREYMKNKKNITYLRKQTVFNKVAGTTSQWTSGTGNCSDDCNNKTIWKPNNDKFKVQGAVSSSSRLDRLKYDTIVSEKKCDDGTCKGVYFAGKPRFTGWIYNKKHPEKCCPQEKAKKRVQFMRIDNNIKRQNVMTHINKQKTCCLSKK